MLGECWKRIEKLRGGSDSSRIPHSQLSSEISENSEQIDAILNNNLIAEKQKKPFRRLREEGFFPDSQEFKQARRKKNLIGKSQYPIYSQIKSKTPYVLLAPSTFTELARLAAYRMGRRLGALVGFSMPCAVTFAMLEMYAPDKFKFPCKCAKWGGGFIF